MCLQDDFRISLKYKIITRDMAPVCPVDMSGRFTSEVTHFAGQYVKVSVSYCWNMTCFVFVLVIVGVCMIIIIINFYGAYVLWNLSSEVQQNRIIKHNREQGCAKVIIIRSRDN